MASSRLELHELYSQRTSTDRVLIDQALLMIGLDPPAEYNPCDAAQVLLDLGMEYITQ